MYTVHTALTLAILLIWLASTAILCAIAEGITQALRHRKQAEPTHRARRAQH